MDLTSIGVGIFGKALDFADTAVQYYNQKKLNRQAQKDTQQNMQLQKDLNLKQQYDSIAQYTSALRAAGLNPALASSGVQQAQGVSMAAGSAGAAAKPENSFAATLEAANALEKQESEVENLKANTELQKQETREKKIKNDREQTKDSLVSSSFLDMLSEMREETDSPFIRGFIEQFEESVTDNDMNVGLLESFNKTFYELSQKERDRELDYLAKEFDKSVYQEQFANNAAAQLADMPRATRMQIYRNCALMLAQIGQLNAETSLTEDKRNLIRSNISKLGQEVQSLLHHDPAAMWHSGDISGMLAMVGYDAVKAAASGVGFGAGAAIGSRVGGSAAGATKTVVDMNKTFSGSGFRPEKLPTKIKGSQPKQLQIHQLQQQLEKMRNDGTKYFKPNLYRKKLDELERVKYGVK